MFADDLMIIDRLRAEAVNVQEPHVSGISRLVTYAAQLKWLGGKFPIDVRRLAPIPLYYLGSRLTSPNI
jgi:programmed cell death 6-interacting protein